MNLMFSFKAALIFWLQHLAARPQLTVRQRGLVSSRAYCTLQAARRGGAARSPALKATQTGGARAAAGFKAGGENGPSGVR